MAPRLPPDLEHLGDQLAAAAARDLAARRRRAARLGRLAATAAAAVVAFTALAPARLDPAAAPPGTHSVLAAGSPEPTAIRIACDQPRGGRVVLAACRPAPAVTRGRARWY